MDTPGLGSDEFRLSPASIRDEGVKVDSNKVIVLLVISKQDEKVTTLRMLIKDQLIHFENPKFAIVWSRKADDLEQYEVDKREAEIHFGNVLYGQFDMEIATESLLASLCNVPTTGFNIDLPEADYSPKKKRNKPDDVMSMFFDQHAPLELTKEHAPGISYSAYTKADYAEALYHYAGESERPKVQKYVLSWILKEGKKKIAVDGEI